MAALAGIEKAALDSAVAALETVKADLEQSQTMPFNIGDMQNDQTFITETENGAVLVTGSPQARRLYYHPEYNFQQGKNKNAGGKWLEPYISGSKKDMAGNAFSAALKGRLYK